MAGRPKSPQSFKQMLDIALKEKGEKDTRLRDVAERLVVEAIKGEGWAIKEIADRMDGKVAQQLRHADEDGGPLQINIVRYSDGNKPSE